MGPTRHEPTRFDHEAYFFNGLVCLLGFLADLRPIFGWAWLEMDGLLGYNEKGIMLGYELGSSR